jgi:hypothetical protein
LKTPRVSRTRFGVFQPSIQWRPPSKLANVTISQPEARQVRRQRRHRDQPASQPFLPGVLSDHAVVSRDIRLPISKIRFLPEGKSFADFKRGDDLSAESGVPGATASTPSQGVSDVALQDRLDGDIRWNPPSRPGAGRSDWDNHVRLGWK